MSESGYNYTFTNSLKSGAINVFIKQKGSSRRGALPGNASLLKPGEKRELVGFQGRMTSLLLLFQNWCPVWEHK